MGYGKHPSAAETNAIVSAQYQTQPALSVDALVSPQYQTHPEGVISPLSILGTSAVLQWIRADLGITAGTAPSFTAPRDFSNAAWTATAVTFDTGITDPDGGTNAQRLIETIANSAHAVEQVPTNIGSASTVTASVASKPGTFATPRTRVYIEGNGGTSRCVFNVNTGAIISQTGGTATITALSGGFYRCTMTYTRTSGTAVRYGLASGDATFSYVGLITADLILYDATVTELPRVAAWADQSGNARDYLQATATAQPELSVAGGPNATAIVKFNGLSSQMTAATLALPAPGTTPTYVWLVLLQDTWTINEVFLSGQDGTARHQLAQLTSTPTLGANNGGTANSSSALALDAWGRVEIGFTNSTSDFIKLIATAVTGNNNGNNSSTSRVIGCRNATAFANVWLAELFYANRIPSAAERTALDAYCTARYGAGLV